MDDRLRQLLDREEIRGLMARYARAVDRMDTAALREVYHPDAYDDHGDYQGGLDGLIGYVTERIGGVPQVMHFLGQCHIEFAASDVALVETYFMTAHTLGPEAQAAYGVQDSGGAVQISMFGRYVDRTERRDGVWRIAQRDTVFEATRVFTGVVPPIKPDWALHRRDQDDPVYRRRQEVGL
ncbi:nuclear transport factor 2 family protein [Amycolatopsis sp. Poz14]|uniref:nuclear transport factor 2 family protein n=1 Tax=Amycolatopsis sp. Poz14 TaxID=1447705 RepID=UPI001EE808BA|nr:nuclear transport factor 2 family protein [Amycolatopsis sp. Poz14]MCG3753996.1 nuclear transport factor 2 family protein [Amycolatopsis sp. Poz14]